MLLIDPFEIELRKTLDKLSITQFDNNLIDYQNYCMRLAKIFAQRRQISDFQTKIKNAALQGRNLINHREISRYVWDFELMTFN